MHGARGRGPAHHGHRSSGSAVDPQDQPRFSAGPRAVPTLHGHPWGRGRRVRRAGKAERGRAWRGTPAGGWQPLSLGRGAVDVCHHTGETSAMHTPNQEQTTQGRWMKKEIVGSANAGGDAKRGQPVVSECKRKKPGKLLSGRPALAGPRVQGLEPTKASQGPLGAAFGAWAHSPAPDRYS